MKDDGRGKEIANKGTERAGVGFMMTRDMYNKTKDYNRINGRRMTATTKTLDQILLSLTHTHAKAWLGKQAEEINKQPERKLIKGNRRKTFMEKQVEEEVNNHNKNAPIIIAGDFIARIHYRRPGEEDICRPHTHNIYMYVEEEENI